MQSALRSPVCVVHRLCKLCLCCVQLQLCAQAAAGPQVICVTAQLLIRGVQGGKLGKTEMERQQGGKESMR